MAARKTKAPPAPFYPEDPMNGSLPPVQEGDDVIYVLEAHFSLPYYESEAAGLPFPKKDIPTAQNPALKAVGTKLRCKVQSIQNYGAEVLPDGTVSETVRVFNLLAPEAKKPFNSKPFKVTYLGNPPCEPLVPVRIYERAMNRDWQQGELFQMWFDDSDWSKGRIVARLPLESSPAGFEALHVEWLDQSTGQYNDDPGNNRLSIWEIRDIPQMHEMAVGPPIEPPAKKKKPTSVGVSPKMVQQAAPMDLEDQRAAQEAAAQQAAQQAEARAAKQRADAEKKAAEAEKKAAAAAARKEKDAEKKAKKEADDLLRRQQQEKAQEEARVRQEAEARQNEENRRLQEGRQKQQAEQREREKKSKAENDRKLAQQEQEKRAQAEKNAAEEAAKREEENIKRQVLQAQREEEARKKEEELKDDRKLQTMLGQMQVLMIAKPEKIQMVWGSKPLTYDWTAGSIPVGLDDFNAKHMDYGAHIRYIKHDLRGRMVNLDKRLHEYQHCIAFLLNSNDSASPDKDDQPERYAWGRVHTQFTTPDHETVLLVSQFLLPSSRRLIGLDLRLLHPLEADGSINVFATNGYVTVPVSMVVHRYENVQGTDGVHRCPTVRVHDLLNIQGRLVTVIPDSALP